MPFSDEAFCQIQSNLCEIYQNLTSPKIKFNFSATWWVWSGGFLVLRGKCLCPITSKRGLLLFAPRWWYRLGEGKQKECSSLWGFIVSIEPDDWSARGAWLITRQRPLLALGTHEVVIGLAQFHVFRTVKPINYAKFAFDSNIKWGFQCQTETKCPNKGWICLFEREEATNKRHDFY